MRRAMQARPVQALEAVRVEDEAHSGSEEHSSQASVRRSVLPEQLKKRPSVMKSVPHFLKGPFCNAPRLALEEAVSEDAIRQERGWKLLLLLPRMLLFPPPRGGTISKDKLHDRFQSFARGEWLVLLEASAHCDELAAIARRRRRGRGDDMQKRAARAELKVALGELSSARQALEGEEVAPGTRADESKRPPRLRDAVPPEIMSHTSSSVRVGYSQVFEEREVSEERCRSRTFGDDYGALAPFVGFSQGPTVVVQVGAAGCRGWYHSDCGRGHQDG